MFLKKKRYCELQSCKNPITSDSAKIRMNIEGSEDGDYWEIAVCDECEKLLEVLQEKSHELMSYKDESI